MSENKTTGQQLSEELYYNTSNVWNKISDEESNQISSFSEDYKKFLDSSKTEREFVKEAEKLAKARGFVSIENIINSNTALKQGMKVYRVLKNKAIALAVIGSKPLEQGINLVGAHIDSPRLDLKPNPVYESRDMVF